MVAMKDKSMGRFSVEVDLANDEDLISAKSGAISPSQVRHERIRGVVDSGATYLVLPEAVVKRLGLTIDGTTRVRFADGRNADRAVATRVNLRFAGREGIFRAIVEPGRETALIGAIVMEDLDLIIGCSNQRLVPRDPDRIIAEIE